VDEKVNEEQDEGFKILFDEILNEEWEKLEVESFNEEGDE
jgi:hypothetical protein